MAHVPSTLTALVRRARRPIVVQTLRSTAAATVSYVAADHLTNVSAPLLAPLTALLVVQVTLFSTLTTGARRVGAVVLGVLVAAGFSTLMGLTWWSLGLLILSTLVIGHLARVDEFVPEVAISGMLVLGVSQVAETAMERIAETLIGAVMGLLINVIFVPPVWVGSASADIETQARRMRRLLTHLGEQAEEDRTQLPRAAARLDEARRLDHDIAEVDASIHQAEESTRLNPRVKEPLLTRIVLRTGLDTLEVCGVLMRTLTRSMTDLAARQAEGRAEDEPLFPPEVAPALHEVMTNLAGAVDSFATLITSQVSAAADEAESFLAVELDAARTSREHVAKVLLERVQEHPRHWQLHGSILNDIDRMLDELDIEKRSVHLAEELDRVSQETSAGRVATQVKRVTDPVHRRVRGLRHRTRRLTRRLGARRRP
ncbi:aromatic acid exporter family protein [Streptomyces sp. DSM 44917]|uniref:Aromatic acid exporter family protein n=1 Tax=Streptomyces boetiae TaxID=3075541 RepID=A0ABU2L5H6_9ACTN|nr:aromatic acid exporter family protein [Streptomyces sp. DSM 44917]MDT0306686.1 aromatic acid exporter family protein [Streptomyces sp. DSM 44917]